ERPTLSGLGEAIAHHGVTTLWLTAGLFHQAIEAKPEMFGALRRLLAGGDVLSPAHVVSALAALPSGASLVNGYGPTENTTFTCCYELRAGDAVDAVRAAVPIGSPIANTRAFVLDRELQPVPIGVAGELCAGGDGLARGYLGRPELTAERFVPSPVGFGERLYRIGDRVRYRTAGGADGTIEFLGRLDRQVKIRGFRVEPGEVEAALALHPSVQMAAVVTRDGAAGRTLAAFVVPRNGEAVSGEELRGYLSERLPEPMVPSSFHGLVELPLTVNGKVDRTALSALSAAAPVGGTVVAPRDVLELRLVQLWQEVLGVEDLGVRQGFFEVGGHSLLAVRLLARVEEELGVELPLSALFTGGTIEAMAGQIRQGACGSAEIVVPIQPEGAEVPLFCVHPAGGDVLCFAALAHHLGREQPFYGLQSVGLAGEAEPLDDLPAMAALYVSEVKRLQPAGPYRLSGWSFGGLAAYEMARQLRERGEEVELLLLDSTIEVAGTDRGLDDTEALLDVASYIASLWGKDLELGREELEGLDLEGQLELLVGKLREVDFLPLGAGAGQLRRVLAVYKANSRAVAGYAPRPTMGPIVLFKAGDALDRPLRDDLGWGSLTPEPVEVHVVPGDHTTLLAEPHVRTLAARLSEVLAGGAPVPLPSSSL
ncbi:MAG TPA: thioesterase domain-containing protein, partial [Thermoanaerobaculia bacterium]